MSQALKRQLKQIEAELAEIRAGKEEAKKCLLGKFIFEKAEAYQEPVRKGQPRKREGEPWGFSKAKYVSALFSLTSAPQGPIAKAAGANYYSLMVWRTQPVYRKLIESFMREFTKIVLNRLDERIEEGKKLLADCFSLPPENFLQGNIPTIGYDEFADWDQYHPDLVIMILAAIASRYQEAEAKNPVDSSALFVQLIHLFEAAERNLGWKKPEDYPPEIKPVKEMIESEKNLIRNYLRNALLSIPANNKRIINANFVMALNF